MKIDMAEIGGAPVLSGAVNGRAAFVSLVRAIDKEPDEPSPLFLDFRNVEAATASYLRESVFALKAYTRTTNSKHYPVVANISSDVWDEMAVVAALMRDVILSCDLNEQDKPSMSEMIGILEPKQKMTFEAVRDSEQVDANSLMDRFGETEGVKGPTAWNNRLASLVSRGIIREFAQGRAKSYRPLF